VLPWLARYLWAGWTEAKVLRAAQALRPLLIDAPALHRALAESAGVGHLIERRGLIYTYENRAQFESEAMAWRIRRQVGIEWLELDADEMRQREPELDRRYTFGALVEEGGHCRDPGAYVAALVAQARAEGAEWRRERATGFRVEGGRLRAVRTEGDEVACDRAVISAGARSRTLAAAVGSTVPLETERGYHAMVVDAEVGPRTPMMPYDGKMSITLDRPGAALRRAGGDRRAGGRAELEAGGDPARSLASELPRPAARPAAGTGEGLDGAPAVDAGRTPLHRAGGGDAGRAAGLRPRACRAGGGTTDGTGGDRSPGRAPARAANGTIQPLALRVTSFCAGFSRHVVQSCAVATPHRVGSRPPVRIA
jgi:glycine/D-amino acid oxidase-like deaminating enzyme